PTDLEDCAQCLLEGFFKTDMTPEILTFFIDYSYVLIGKSSFTLVAESDGKVVGFICGEYQKSFDQGLAKKTVHSVTWAFLKWMLKYQTGRYKLPKDFQKEFKIFLAFARNMEGKELGVCDCELSALSSRRDYRRGLGTALVNKMLARCREANAKSIRLFTNTDSTYQFYDKHGFTRLAEKSFKWDGHSGTSFLYEIQID
ncbi:MAG: GNAT family N-acetyltransferase, partial [Oscillospiraceae bacterium]